MKNMLRKTWLIVIVILFIGASVIPSINADLKTKEFTPIMDDWSDNFDSYTNGQRLDGDPEDGGWDGWDGIPEAGGTVTDFESNSAPHSVELVDQEDLVHEFAGVDSGQWTFTCYVFIPVDIIGSPAFIMLNTYSHGGTKHWSTEITFNTVTDMITSYEGATLPLVYDEWIELRNEIDLDADTQAIYYNGDLLIEKSWSAGVSGAGGLTEIQCVDLWSNGADYHYYDDFSLIETIPTGPNLDCSGALDFDEVVPGETVTGTITVENVGEVGSELSWEVMENPEWGTWTFTPDSGTGLIAGDTVTIDVEIIAPEDTNSEFDGEVILVNTEDAGDTCTVDVTLVTPVSQSVTFLELLAQRFPILARILELIF